MLTHPSARLVVAVSLMASCNLFSASPETEQFDSAVPDAPTQDGGTPDLPSASDGATDSQFRADLPAAEDAAPDLPPTKVDLGADQGVDAADLCSPEPDGAVCATAGAECGALTANDNCGVTRAVECGDCAAPETCSQNQCVCVAETDAAFCARVVANCDDVTAEDNCGVMRTTNCGMCTAPATCGGGGTPNVCACAAQSDADFCMAANAVCGAYTGVDMCGQARTADCGSCQAPETCAGLGTPNTCECAPNSDATLCAAAGATCGQVMATDNCGAARSPDCGACTAPESCGDGGVPNACGCTGESDSELCAAAGAVCGTLGVNDSCGQARTAACGSCSTGTCDAANQCSSATQFSSTVNANIPPNGTPISDTITVSGCPTLLSVTVDVDFTHTYRGDLQIDLQSAEGTVVRLKTADISESGADLLGNYPLTLTPVESLSILNGEAANGLWTLTVSDELAQDTGDWNSWSLNLVCQ